MASITSNGVLPWLPILLLFPIFCQVSTDSPYSIQPISVDVGFLWEHPRDENHHSTEIIVKSTHVNIQSKLRVICFISPPLPAKYENKKNEIVKWEKKVASGREPISSVRLWDDGLTTTAFSFEKITYDVIGTYVCSYGELSKEISVKVANVDMIRQLKMPSNFEEIMNYATHIKDATGIDGWNPHLSLLQSEGQSMSCKRPSKVSRTPPTTIHQVRPRDIKVIAALGDGFTTGFGAKASSWNGFFADYRGVSWSVGGAGHLNTTTTLPNIFKEFNPDLLGFATLTSKNDLNKAQVHSSSSDLENQVSELIKSLKNNKEIDFENDWKVLTIWTGMVDLCHVCQDHNKYSSGNYIKNIMHSLGILKKQVPRMYVNLIPPMDVSTLHKLFTKNPTCQILNWNSCPCAADTNEEQRNLVAEAAKEYLSLLEKLIYSGVYDTTDQFTVVLQPFMSSGPTTKDGKLAENLFGPDCLHFNVKGHSAAAVALWNNMLVPLDTKPKQWIVDDQNITCPIQTNSYLATKKNTNLVVSSDDDDESHVMPPAAAITLSIFLTIVVLVVTIFVWRSRKSRPRTDKMRLLAFPHRPRI